MNTKLINDRKRELNLTNLSLSLKTGISLSTISKICSGIIKNTSSDNLEKLSKILNCSVSDLLEKSEIEIETIEDEVKKIILDKYGSINNFSKFTNMNRNTISRILKDGFDSATFGKLKPIFKELDLSFDDFVYLNEINRHNNDLQKNIFVEIKQLNTYGLNKVDEYIKDILKIDEYKKSYKIDNKNILITSVESENVIKIDTNPNITTRRARNEKENIENEQDLMELDFQKMMELKNKK